MSKKFKGYFFALLGVAFLIIIATSNSKKEMYQNAQTEITAIKESTSEGKIEAAEIKTDIVKVEKASDNVVQNNSQKNDLEKDNKKQSLSRGGVSLLNKDEVTKKIETSKKTSQTSIQTADWWKSGRYAFPVGATAEVEDVFTGKKFKVKRTMGDNHADVETLTKEDTNILKSIWNGFSWERRPVILNIDGKRYAASMSAMPHAGLDADPAFVTVDNRSGGYGRGQNLDVIKGNGMEGHIDIHFLNSTRHKDGKTDPQHQNAISKVPKTTN